MTFSKFEAKAAKLSFDKEVMSVHLLDGRVLVVPLAYFPRLANAKASERKKYTISGGGEGLHWDELDEDISVPNLLQGYIDQTSPISNPNSAAS